MSNLNPGLFRLKVSDFAKGAVSAVLAAVIFAVVGFLNQPGFDIFSADWNAILGNAVNAAIAAFVGYLSKNLLSNDNGEVVTPIGNIK